MIPLVEKSECGGEWYIELSNYGELKRIFYNGKEVTKRISAGGWMEEAILKFFDQRYNLDSFIRDYIKDYADYYAQETY